MRFETYMVEQTISFGEIDDIDLDCVREFTRVLHSEVKPLEISVSIRVITHPAVESCLAFHSYLVQICTLEVSIKVHI